MTMGYTIINACNGDRYMYYETRLHPVYDIFINLIKSQFLSSISINDYVFFKVYCNL